MLFKRIEVTFPLHFVYLFVQMYVFFLLKLHQHNVLSSSIVCPTICMMQYYGTRAGIFFVVVLSSFGFLSTFYQFSSWLWHLRFHTHTGRFDIKIFPDFQIILAKYFRIKYTSQIFHSCIQFSNNLIIVRMTTKSL